MSRSGGPLADALVRVGDGAAGLRESLPSGLGLVLALAVTRLAYFFLKGIPVCSLNNLICTTYSGCYTKVMGHAGIQFVLLFPRSFASHRVKFF